MVRVAPDARHGGVLDRLEPLRAAFAILVAAAALLARLVIIWRLPDGGSRRLRPFWRGARASGRSDQPRSALGWLPGWHYVLWAMLRMGFSFQGVRMVNAVAQAFAPLLLYSFVSGLRAQPNDLRARRVAWIAALAWTVAPLRTCSPLRRKPKPCSQSSCSPAHAQSIAVALRWPGYGSRWHVCMRYEAWGALAALLIRKLLKKGSVGWSAVVVAALAIALWTVIRWSVDGQWMAFAWQTQAFVVRLRTTSGVGPIDAVLSFFLRGPWSAMGPVLLLAPFGMPRVIRSRWIVPGGVAGFLLLSYLARGSLDLNRYLTCLVPFACVAVAEVIVRDTELVPRMPRAVPIGIMTALMAVTTRARLTSFVARTVAQEVALRQMQLESVR